MRKLVAVVASIVAASLLAPAPVAGTVLAGYAQVGNEAVVDGVTHDWGTTQTDTATQQVNVLRVAHAASDIEFGLGLPLGHASGRQRTTYDAGADSTIRHRVVGAINGDFWSKSDLVSGAPVGLEVRSGELVSGKGGEQRAAFGVHPDGARMIGSPRLVVTVGLPGMVAVSAAGVNRIRGADELLVYTPRFGASTQTDASGVEVRLVGATLPLTVNGTWSATVADVRSNAGNTTIADGELILSACGTATSALAALKANDRVTIETSIDSNWHDVQTAVGGLLLFDGNTIPDFTEPKYQVPNPRTAIGLTDAGDAMLVTVDGRSENSGGMSLPDLADVLRGMGAVRGINLDGGGSTTMVVDPAGDSPLAVANSPSSGYERRVNTTLEVISTAYAGPSVSAPSASIVADVATGMSDANVRLSWTAGAETSVASTQLQILGADGTWRDVSLAYARATSLVRRFRFGRGYKFRVRVTDTAGAISAWAVSPTFELDRFNESDPAVTRSGAWRIRYLSSAIGNHVATSSFGGGPPTIWMVANGYEVAVVAQKRSSAGTAAVTLAGATSMVDLHSSRSRPRIVVFVGRIAGTVSVANTASAARPFVDIDAFLVLTTR